MVDLYDILFKMRYKNFVLRMIYYINCLINLLTSPGEEFSIFRYPYLSTGTPHKESQRVNRKMFKIILKFIILKYYYKNIIFKIKILEFTFLNIFKKKLD